MAFGMASSPFSISTPQQQQQSSFLFATPQQQQQQQLQQQQQQQQQQIHLLTTEKTPVSYHTKWADLHPDSQKLLLQVEERILEYRDESRRLDQCERLFDSFALKEGFEVDAARISQELGRITAAMDREKVSLQELMKAAKEMIRNAEVAVRSYIMLRSRFPRTIAPTPANTAALAANISVQSIGAGAGELSHSMASTLPVVDFYSGVPTKPSPFLLHTVTGFEHRLHEYRQWIEELERLLFADFEENGKETSQLSLLQSLPTVITNIYDFFIHVTAKVDALHQQIVSMRAAYLADQRRRGDDNNPFLEADRREVAKKEAAAKRVHPTLQASILSQPSTQLAGLLTSATAPPFSGHPNATSSTFSGSLSSPIFANSSVTSSSSPFFGTPSTSGPVSSPFSSSTTPSFSLFGSSGASTTPSLIGSGMPTSIFGSGPAVGSSSSLFSSSALAGASAASPSGGLFAATPVASGSIFGSSPSPSGGVFGGGQTSGNIFGNPVQRLGGSTVLNTGTPAFGIGTAQGTATTKTKARPVRRK